MNPMFETLGSICNAWNDACAEVNKDEKRYNRLLQRLQSVNPTSIEHKKPPAEAVVGKTGSGYKVWIFASGQYTCTCDSFKYSSRKSLNSSLSKFPCKHIAVIAGHAAVHFMKRGATWLK